MSVYATLDERGKTYGSFDDYAEICDKLKTIKVDADKERFSLGYLHSEALDMIFSKVARILSGDPNYIDNWHDIAGYATLVENELKKGEEQ